MRHVEGHHKNGAVLTDRQRRAMRHREFIGEIKPRHRRMIEAACDFWWYRKQHGLA